MYIVGKDLFYFREDTSCIDNKRRWQAYTVDVKYGERDGQQEQHSLPQKDFYSDTS